MDNCNNLNAEYNSYQHDIKDIKEKVINNLTDSNASEDVNKL